MAALLCLIYFGCFIVSLTLAPDYLQMPFAVASVILLTITGLWGISRGSAI